MGEPTAHEQLFHQDECPGGKEAAMLIAIRGTFYAGGSSPHKDFILFKAHDSDNWAKLAGCVHLWSLSTYAPTILRFGYIPAN